MFLPGEIPEEPPLLCGILNGKPQAHRQPPQRGEEEEEKARSIAWATTKGAIVVAAFALLFRFVTTYEVVTALRTNSYYNAPTANDIGYWAILSASISLLVISIIYFTSAMILHR